MASTLSDIAEKANVSISTVGLVLNNAGSGTRRVSQQTAFKIREIAEKYNYVPNRAAQQLVNSRSTTIGVLIDPFPSEENGIRLAAINKRARELGYHLMILHERPDSDLISESLNDFVSRGVEGIICVHHSYPNNKSLIPEMVSSKLKKVVFLDEPTEKKAKFVGADFAKGTCLAVEHLRNRGCRHIGLSICDLQWYSGPKIKQGYIKGLQENGLAIDEKLIWVSNQDINSDMVHISREIANQIIDCLVVEHKADAIIAHDDYMAAQIINCLRSRWIRIPEDVAVIGNGNWHIATLTQPMLTTVDYNLRTVGILAVEKLIQMIEGDTKDNLSNGIFVEPNIIKRETA